MDSKKTIVRGALILGIPLLVLVAAVTLFVIGAMTNSGSQSATGEAGSLDDGLAVGGTVSGVDGFELVSDPTLAADDAVDFRDDVIQLSGLGTSDSSFIDPFSGDPARAGSSLNPDSTFNVEDWLASDALQTFDTDDWSISASSFNMDSFMTGDIFEPIPFAIGGGSGCGKLPFSIGDGSGGGSDPSAWAGLIEEWIKLDVYTCMGENFVHNCTQANADPGGGESVLLYNHPSLGCTYGITNHASKYNDKSLEMREIAPCPKDMSDGVRDAYEQRGIECDYSTDPPMLKNVREFNDFVAMCPIRVSPDLRAKLEELNIKITGKEEDLIDIVADLATAEATLVTARAELDAAIAALESATTSEAVEYWTGEVNRLTALVAATEVSIEELKIELEELEELRDEVYALIFLTAARSTSGCAMYDLGKSKSIDDDEGDGA